MRVRHRCILTWPALKFLLFLLLLPPASALALGVRGNGNALKKVCDMNFMNLLVIKQQKNTAEVVKIINMSSSGNHR